MRNQAVAATASRTARKEAVYDRIILLLVLWRKHQNFARNANSHILAYAKRIHATYVNQRIGEKMLFIAMWKQIASLKMAPSPLRITHQQLPQHHQHLPLSNVLSTQALPPSPCPPRRRQLR